MDEALTTDIMSALCGGRAGGGSSDARDQGAIGEIYSWSRAVNKHPLHLWTLA